MSRGRELAQMSRFRRAARSAENRRRGNQVLRGRRKAAKMRESAPETGAKPAPGVHPPRDWRAAQRPAVGGDGGNDGGSHAR